MVSLRGQARGQGDGQNVFAGKRARSKLEGVLRAGGEVAGHSGSTLHVRSDGSREGEGGHEGG